MPPLSVYIHVPFCQRKCHYCDFNTYAGIDHLIAPYVDALLTEIRNWSGPARDSRVTTIFLGGGTPSLLTASQMRAVLDACRAAFSLVPGAEITIEANPGTVDAGKLEQYRDAGVNRISFGAQSFDAGELAWLGRIHSEQQVGEAVTMARRAGFRRLNLDLICGLPGQSTARWEANLHSALALGPEHLSLYALSVEEGTPLAGWVATGRTPEPDPDVAADHYLAADAILSQAGFENYEISNWSRPGEECRHNLTYWENREYLGLGAGAHGRFDGFRYHNVLLPQEYVRRVNSDEGLAATGRRLLTDMREQGQFPSPMAGIDRVEMEEDMLDTLTLGLRLAQGIGFEDFNSRHRVDLRLRYPVVIAEAAALGLLRVEQERIALTLRGRLLANEVFVRFINAGESSVRQDVPQPIGLLAN